MYPLLCNYVAYNLAFSEVKIIFIRSTNFRPWSCWHGAISLYYTK